MVRSWKTTRGLWADALDEEQQAREMDCDDDGDFERNGIRPHCLSPMPCMEVESLDKRTFDDFGDESQDILLDRDLLNAMDNRQHYLRRSASPCVECSDSSVIFIECELSPTNLLQFIFVFCFFGDLFRFRLQPTS